MADLKRELSEKENLAQEEALEKETQARQALQEQLREQQDQHREETDRLLRLCFSLEIQLRAKQTTPLVLYGNEVTLRQQNWS